MKEISNITNLIYQKEFESYLKKIYSSLYNIGKSCTDLFPIYSLFKNKENKYIIYIGYTYDNVYNEYNLIFLSESNVTPIDIIVPISKFENKFNNNILTTYFYNETKNYKFMLISNEKEKNIIYKKILAERVYK